MIEGRLYGRSVQQTRQLIVFGCLSQPGTQGDLFEQRPGDLAEKVQWFRTHPFKVIAAVDGDAEASGEHLRRRQAKTHELLAPQHLRFQVVRQVVDPPGGQHRFGYRTCCKDGTDATSVIRCPPGKCEARGG